MGWFQLLMSTLFVIAVCSCEPPVEALPRYVDALNNKSLKFSEFVRTMRRAFCNVAAAGCAL